MKLLAGICLVGALVASTVQAAHDDSSIPPEDDTAWRLVWSDEFDSPVIDPERWNLEVDCWGGGNAERQCYTNFDQNARIEDGHLVIEAHLGEAQGPALPAHMREGADAEALAATQIQPFTSARLNTRDKGDWLYGRIEVRARLPEGQGMWPAIWMLPTDEVYGSWASSGEIDILEAVNLGEPCRECRGGIENRMFGTLHYGDVWPHNTYQNRETVLPGRAEDGQEFHVFAIEWTAGEIRWFVDGETYGSLTRRRWRSASDEARGRPNAPFDQRFHLILNLAVGGHLAEGRNEGGVRLEGFPKNMLVDWVRVYDCPADLETARACAE
jgi:beta-glucanase (GH16 family)